MNDEMDWSRYGLIAELAQRLQHTGTRQFGKTVLQKLAFLLQEVYRVDLGYSFVFYTYGPFAPELQSDLDFAQCVGAVNVEPVSEAQGSGYRIVPGTMCQQTLDKARSFLDVTRDALTRLVEAFGAKTAKELELLTTVVFLSKEASCLEPAMPVDKAIGLVRELKPKFSEVEVREAMHELASRHAVKLSFAGC
jgi:uncharacterized protein